MVKSADHSTEHGAEQKSGKGVDRERKGVHGKLWFTERFAGAGRQQDTNSQLGRPPWGIHPMVRRITSAARMHLSPRHQARPQYLCHNNAFEGSALRHSHEDTADRCSRPVLRWTGGGGWQKGNRPFC
jgi:hypothetical protein